MKFNILLTGSSGFLGGQIVNLLQRIPDVRLTVAVRRFTDMSGVTVMQIPSLDANTDFSSALAGQTVVIHAAARAHFIKDEATEPMTEYRRVNVEATLNLARQAASAGVARFIFISSIGVNGNFNSRPFTEYDAANPTGLYALSKWEAEQGLWKIQRETGMELVIIRPPLVYGPNAPGNFGRLMHLVEKGVPLPLGSVHNKRTLVAADNLADLIITCIDHPAAANEVFLAGDAEDLSTTALLRGVARVMCKPSRLIPVPVSFLMVVATLLGKKRVAQQLLGSLQVDITKARDLLGWTPPISVEEGLRRCLQSKLE